MQVVYFKMLDVVRSKVEVKLHYLSRKKGILFFILIIFALVRRICRVSWF